MSTSLIEELFAVHLSELTDMKPEREFQFAKEEGRRWRFDFAFPDMGLAIEIDGGTFSGGRHVRGAGFEKDCEKNNAAQLLGWYVLHFTGDMVKCGRAKEGARMALSALGAEMKE